MKFIKKKIKQIIFLASIFLISFATEIFITNQSFPKYSISFFGIFLICSFQYYYYLRIRATFKKEIDRIKLTKNFESIADRQERINRNLMFAIEEIIDLQRDLISKRESVH
jgi:hypothetical protein